VRARAHLPLAFGLALLTFGLAGTPVHTPPTATETVLATHRVREGKEAEYAELLALQWSTLRRLNLVLERPHVILRGFDESGKTIFVEVLTWRDHDAPDSVPPEVEKIWEALEASAEPRLGHRGIEFPEFEVVAREACAEAKPAAK